MEPLTVTALAALVWKITSVVKAIGKDWNRVITQAVVWAAGIVVIWVGSVADITEGLAPIAGGPILGDYDAGSVILAGLMLGSLAAVGYDVKKSIDNTDSSSEPPLIAS